MSIKIVLIVIKIAWKNIWRSKTRSMVVIVAVALGLWAGIFTSSFMYGISDQRLQGIINSQISHLQIHYPGFTDDLEAGLLIPNSREIMDELKQHKTIKGITGRVLSPGMIASTTSGSGVVVQGIIREDEMNVTNIYEKITEGDFFEEEKKNQLVVGQKLAKKLNVKLRSKVVINVQDANGNITAGAFRISGIYKTNSSKYDEGNVFVRQQDLDKLLSSKGHVHEIALILQPDADVDSLKGQLANLFPGLEVKSWKDVAPELDFINEIMDEYLHIFMAIILLAMAFGIINTMLMAILERVREIGMLMAIGMNKFRIFMMIVLETIFLTFTGAPLGMLLSLASIHYLSRTGVDLSVFSEGLASFDLDTVVYPSLDASFYPTLIMMVMVTAVLSSIYPAYKALSLHPATAIRSI